VRFSSGAGDPEEQAPSRSAAASDIETSMPAFALLRLALVSVSTSLSPFALQHCGKRRACPS